MGNSFQKKKLFWMQIVFLVLSIISLFYQCTTIGFHRESVRNNIPFGTEKIFRVCTIIESGIEEEEVLDLFKYWNEELKLYSLKANFVNYGTMERPGFYGSDILNYIANLPMQEDCDRILYLKGRTKGDLVFEVFTLGLFVGTGLKLEVQGAVESRTQTRGYIKAKYISLLQVLFTSPKSTLVHEGYHLLGCGHQLLMDDCYEKIREVKSLSAEPNIEKNFFPNITASGKRIRTRN